MNDKVFTDLRALFDNQFTGNVTLHVQDGSVKKMEIYHVVRPGNGIANEVDLIEGRGGLKG